MAGAAFFACSNRSRTRRCADADVHLDEVGAGNGQELHARLARDGLGKQGLTGARRADEQHALGYARAHIGISLRIAQEVNYLGEVFLLLVAARDVGEGLLILLVSAETRTCLAELGDAAGHVPAAGSLHDEVPRGHGDDDYQHVRQQRHQHERHAGAFGVVILLDDAVDLLLPDQIMEVGIEHREIIDLAADELRPVGAGGGAAEQAVNNAGRGIAVGAVRLCAVRLIGADLHGYLVALDLEGLHPLLGEQLNEIGVFKLLTLRVLGEGQDDGDEDHHHYEVEAEVSGSVAVRFQT